MIHSQSLGVQTYSHHLF